MNWIKKLALGLIGVGALLFLSRFLIVRSSSAPTLLGEKDGLLSPCPNTPNCVSTQHGEEDAGLAPISFAGSESDARGRMVELIRQTSRSKIITNRPGYVHAEFRSMVWGFVDDAEFVFDQENQQIDMRSAARLGYEDFDVNRQRLMRLSTAFEDNG